jgi:hypothetical protein
MKRINLINIYIIFSVIFIILTTPNFSILETVSLGGASDGREYYSISKKAPSFAENIQYIKAERFLIPYTIGVISKYSGLDLFLAYKIFSFLLILYLIKIFVKILKTLKLNNNSILLSVSLIIFNPYLLRYFLSIPTMIGDLIFIISSLLIFDGLINKNKTKIYSGFIISLIARQNGIIFLISFFISKFIFKKKSIISNLDTIYFFSIFLTIFFINTFYATNSSPPNKQIAELYYVTLFGIFTFNYSLNEFILYCLFPILSFGPITLLLLTKNIVSINKMNLEFSIIIILSFLGIVGVAFISGPNITGKNLLRLSNFIYPSMILFINILFLEKVEFLSKKIYLFISLVLLFFWSLHPTFSNIKLFESLKFIFN